VKGIVGIIIFLVVLVAMFFGFKSCSQGGDLGDVVSEATQGVVDTAKKTGEMAGDVADSAANVAGEAAKGLGEFFSVKLPSGISLNIPQMGVENKLIKFIKSGTIDKKTWFDFDRINFASGSSNLSEDSKEQLKNVSEIMKAFPNVKLKVGGYTDNTGSKDVNMRISKSRADSVKASIVSMGVDGSRMETEGYGPAQPIASNDTEEGRAQNRRISLRVTAK